MKHIYFKKKLSLWLCALAVSIATTKTNAYINFPDTVTTRAINLSSEINDEITFTLLLDRTVKDSQNTMLGAHYRLAISEGIPFTPGEVDNSSLPTNFSVENLRPYIKTVSIQNIPWILGRWTYPSRLKTEDNATRGAVAITFTLNRERLLELIGNINGKLSFYIGGQSHGSEEWADYTYVTIPIVNPPSVKVSKLKDIKLMSFVPGSGDKIESAINFCVYSSSASKNYNVYFSSRYNPSVGLPFKLMMYPGDMSNERTISYDVSFKDQSNNQWETVSSAQWLSGNYEGSDNENCNGGTNASLKVGVFRSNLTGKISGAYHDTLEIMVEPN